MSEPVEDHPQVTALDLPAHLAERVRPVDDRPMADGEFVLYWMRTAARGHENPALDVALEAARRLGRPAFVYQALSERYPYASDRHHTFILEGARDVAAELQERGIGYIFHLERQDRRGPHLVTLARRACLVVIEDMPVRPMLRWSRLLWRAIGAPLWRVDTACVVPMRLTAKAHERAFQFRRATEALRAERVGRSWPEVEPPTPTFLPDDLPFTPIDLGTASLPDLVATCAIDHTIAPVPHSPGGSTAGYARWGGFRDQRLRAYPRRRNDALDRDGVSRLSPYLHYGQVSPFRIAREAAALGAAKFLDELLVWREFAYGWCFHTRAHDRLEALPAWAQATLAEHASDPRAERFSWETLARARTGHRLWDAAQRSLLIHGELHNNLRMTWGKALLDWTPDPERCRAMLVDLNHRFALDGRDPNSYGGLYWCLGLFDRPFPPARPVSGTVRRRPLDGHARRLDVDAYEAMTARAVVERAPRVAVIGAGIAGLACARTLRDHGLPVTVVDKSRGASGRLATRRDGPLRFDHGAQYLTARDSRFRRLVESWAEDGVVAPWQAIFARSGDDGIAPAPFDTARYVGTPSMSAIGRHLASDLEILTRVEVERLERDAAGWRLLTGDAVLEDAFDRVVVATPSPQAVSLLQPVPGLAAKAAEAEMDPCWAAMLAFQRPLEVAFDALQATGPISWAARNGSRPGRPDAECWVLHGSPEWSRQHLEDHAGDVLAALVDAFGALVGPLPEPVHATAHRWRFARVAVPLGVDCLYDPDSGIGACGDWCLGARIEAAWLSGAAMAGRILGTLGARR